MILVSGTIRIPPGSLERALPAMREMIHASRKEDGCVAYSYALDVLDDGLVHVVEKWRDQAALDAHFEAPHLLQWRNRFGELGITDRQLSRHQIDAGQPT